MGGTFGFAAGGIEGIGKSFTPKFTKRLVAEKTKRGDRYLDFITGNGGLQGPANSTVFNVNYFKGNIGGILGGGVIEQGTDAFFGERFKKYLNEKVWNMKEDSGEE